MKKIFKSIYFFFYKKLYSKRKNNKKKKNLFIKNKEKTTFIKRKKQLSLNINSMKFLNKIKNNKIWLFIILLFLILLIVLFAILWPYFKIKNINIIKNDDITNISIAYKWVDNLREKSIFNIDKNKISEKLVSYQQNIKTVKTKRIFPNTLKINIESYKWLFNTVKENTDKNYLILENWSLVPQKINKELKSIEIINKKKSLKSFIDYQKIYKEEYIKKINYLINKIEENIFDISILNIKYYVVEREVHISTENTLIIYSLDDDLDEQIKKTVIFNKEHYFLNNVWIYYLDLRIPWKIFYCPKENENDCINTIKSLYWNYK